MKISSFSNMICSIAGALDIVGDRWAILLIRDLFIGLRRYDDFRSSTNIPPTTLSDRLKMLEAEGIIRKSLYQSKPDRFEYSLTKKGRGLWQVLLSLAKWGDEHELSGRQLAPMRFVNSDTGNDVEIKIVDSVLKTEVVPEKILTIEGFGADDQAKKRIQIAELRSSSGY
ncbi:MAG: DNA-binding HxlR family transcriptional regulator [Parasphingorhabdus sp.]|jgi:DNA-binding HxlR family transcriptional regulator|uniref:winged helix-turn-helix transcriptional regulator n=1 Tax=Parasphingorhabdus sp. TaxID=2709688 RepID=UPI0039E38CD1